MKHVKSYQLFLEEVDLEPRDTDAPDLKMAKERFSVLKKQLADFKTKQPLIDKAYTTSATDIDLKAKVESIVGKSEKDRNPFLIEYLTIANLKRNIENSRKDLTEDKIKQDDFQQTVKDATTSTEKESISKKIKEVQSRMSDDKNIIASSMQEIAKAESQLKAKMSKIEKEMQDSIKKISSKVVK